MRYACGMTKPKKLTAKRGGETSRARPSRSAAAVESRRAIARAVELAGGQSELARLIEGHQTDVSMWLSGVRALPAARCGRIEEVTRKLGDPVLCSMLRPDLFPKA